MLKFNLLLEGNNAIIMKIKHKCSYKNLFSLFCRTIANFLDEDISDVSSISDSVYFPGIAACMAIIDEKNLLNNNIENGNA